MPPKFRTVDAKKKNHISKSNMIGSVLHTSRQLPGSKVSFLKHQNMKNLKLNSPFMMRGHVKNISSNGI
jgi:hypothetical protein